MDVAHTSDELLGYFDGENVGATPFARYCVPTRGIRWVLKWAAALGVLFIAASVLLEFAYVLAAEHTLARAARAGALEATLPRANMRSIAKSVERQLTAYPVLTARLQLAVQTNGQRVGGAFHPRQGDLVSVTLAAPTYAVLPGWLRTLKFRGGERPIQVRSERMIPGRALFINR